MGDQPSKLLYRVSTYQRIRDLKETVKKNENEEWKIQLLQDLNVLAADIYYHTSCWTRFVFNSQREKLSNSEHWEDSVRLIEFVEDVRERLEEGLFF